MPDQPQMRSRLSFLSRKSCSFIGAGGETEPPHLRGGVPNTGARIPARHPPRCSQLTSTLMFSFCERRERTSSTSRLKMAWTRGGCRESQLSGSGPEPERNWEVGEHTGWMEGGVAGGAPPQGSWLQRIPAVPPPVARPPRTPAPPRGARRGARREPREPRARAQPRPHIPGLAWRRRRALGRGRGEGQEG